MVSDELLVSIKADIKQLKTSLVSAEKDIVAFKTKTGNAVSGLSGAFNKNVQQLISSSTVLFRSIGNNAGILASQFAGLSRMLFVAIRNPILLSITAIAGLGVALKKSANIASEEKKAFDLLTLSFSNNAKVLYETIRARSGITGVTSEEYTSVLRLLKAYDLNEQQMLDLLPVLEKYSKAYRKDLIEVTKTFGDAIINNNVKALKEYDISLSENMSQQERYEALLRSSSEALDKISEDALKAGGGMKYLANSFKLAMEALSNSAPVKAVKGFINDLLFGLGKGIRSIVGAKAGTLELDDATKKLINTEKNNLSTQREKNKEKIKGMDIDKEELELSQLAYEKQKVFLEYIREKNERLYEQNKISMEEYYNVLFENIYKESEIEKTRLTAIVADEKKSKSEREKASIELMKVKNDLLKKTYEVEKKYNDDILKLTENRLQQEEYVFEVFSEAKNKMVDMAMSSEFDILEKNYAEQIYQYNETLEKLKDLQKKAGVDRLALTEQINTYEYLLNKKQNSLMQEIQMQKTDLILSSLQTISSGYAGFFSDLIELTGNKSREMFEMWKATATAEAIVNTILGVSHAIKEGWKIGGAWGAVVASALGALALAQGMVQVAKIQTTRLTYATGGFIGGKSHAEGGTPIIAERGEYIHPRSAVDYYGVGVMEAIRNKSIPVAVLSAYSQGVSLQNENKKYFADGGAVNRGEVKIINFVDSNLFNRYLASSAGRNAIINIIE